MCRRLVWIVILWCAPLTLHAGSEADLIARSVEGEKLLMSRDYGAGQTLFQKLSEDYPDSPAGAFGLMAMWQTRMFENRDFRFVPQYEAAEKKMEVLCGARLQHNRPSDWDLFVCASGYGMKGFFDGRRDKWLQGLGGAIKSIRAYRRLLWLNPNFEDAEMGVGMYEFWRSVMTQRFRWLPFFSDQRASGIARVQKAVNEGKYTRDLARVNLAYMQMEMKQYDAALAGLNDLIALYPRNMLMRQAKGEVFWWQKKYRECYDIFAEMLSEDPQMTRNLFWMAACSVNSYLERGAKIPEDIATRAKAQLEQYLRSSPINVWAAASHYWLAVIASFQGDKATAIAEYNQALKLDPGGAKEIKQRLEKLQ